MLKYLLIISAAMLLVTAVMCAVRTTNSGDVEPTAAAATPDKNELEMTDQQAQPQQAQTVFADSAIAWGLGGGVDEQNRPLPALQAQQQWGELGGVYIAPTELEQLWLTFDLGYENGYTEKILDTLKEKGVHAVFFVTMDYLESAPEIVQRIIDEGHILANHTDHHYSMPTLSDDEVRAEVMNVHDYVLEHYGYEMRLFRFPKGEFSERSLLLVRELGYESIFWSFAYRDWLTDDQPDPQAALEKLCESLHPGAIYLLHAVSQTNAQIMGDFIDAARAQGYEFVLPYANEDETSVQEEIF